MLDVAGAGSGFDRSIVSRAVSSVSKDVVWSTGSSEASTWATLSSLTIAAWCVSTSGDAGTAARRLPTYACLAASAWMSATCRVVVVLGESTGTFAARRPGVFGVPEPARAGDGTSARW